MMWETVVVSLILIGMLIALIGSGDRLDHWTFQRPGKARPLTAVKVYGMTVKQVRQLRAFYISRTGDARLERL